MSTLERRINHHRVELDEAAEVVCILQPSQPLVYLTPLLTDQLILGEDCDVGGLGCEPPRSRLQVS